MAVGARRCVRSRSANEAGISRGIAFSRCAVTSSGRTALAFEFCPASGEDDFANIQQIIKLDSACFDVALIDMFLQRVALSYLLWSSLLHRSLRSRNPSLQHKEKREQH